MDTPSVLPFDFWAKSDTSDAVMAMHSAPHHCLDVAAAACALLPFFPPPVEVPAASVITLIALHDVGKFSRTFQAKVPQLWPASLGRFEAPPAGYPHDQTGYALLAGQLAPLLDPLFGDWTRAARQPLLRAVAGHHGRPPLVPPGEDVLPQRVVCGTCLDAASSFVHSVFALLEPPSLPRLSARDRQALAWWAAGFTVVADWVGSARNWFPTVDAASNTDLVAYWCGRANRRNAPCGRPAWYQQPWRQAPACATCSRRSMRRGRCSSGQSRWRCLTGRACS